MARRDLVKRSRVPALPAPPPMALGHGGGIRSNFIRTALETVNRAGRRVIDCRKTNGQTHWWEGVRKNGKKTEEKKILKPTVADVEQRRQTQTFRTVSSSGAHNKGLGGIAARHVARNIFLGG